MKIRNDFVSNSSSCSFIIYLTSKSDVDNIKTAYEKIKNLASFEVFGDIDCFDKCGDLSNADSLDIKGMFVKVDAGEDHDMKIIDNFYDIQDFFTNLEYKFKIYKDSDAHYTFGNNWKRTR